MTEYDAEAGTQMGDEETPPQKQKPTPVTPPKPDKKSEQAGGKCNYLIVCFWITLGYCGFAIVIGGLSSLQNYTNRSASSDSPGLPDKRQIPSNPDVSGWSLVSNYPWLPPGRVFRLDWFITFADFIVLVVVSAACCSKAVRQTRPLLVGWMSAAAVLSVIESDRFYNVSHFVHSANYSAARATFSGFVVMATSFFCLIYMLGIEY